jgi:hypothetical protein
VKNSTDLGIKFALIPGSPLKMVIYIIIQNIGILLKWILDFMKLSIKVGNVEIGFTEI